MPASLKIGPSETLAVLHDGKWETEDENLLKVLNLITRQTIIPPVPDRDGFLAEAVRRRIGGAVSHLKQSVTPNPPKGTEKNRVY